MSELPLSVDATPASTAVLHAPWTGVWTADFDLPTDEVPSGRVEARIGDLVFSGTVDPERSGAFRSGARVRLVGGAGGWSKAAPRRHFHADQGLKRRVVLEDTARAVGETLDLDSALADAVIGVDFVREDTDEAGFAVPASTVLARAGAPLWWVGYDGVTRAAGTRPTPATGAVEVLNFDTRLRTVELADVAPIEVGSVLQLDGAEEVVRELRIHATAKAARTIAVVANVQFNRIYDAIAAIARHATAERLHGLFVFRVFDMAGDRARLQRASKKAVPGLPDVLLVSQWPGTAGAWAKLREGALVLVEFIEGDVTRPIVARAERKEGEGFLPLELLLDAEELVELGPSAAAVEIAGGGKALHRVDDFGEAGSLTGGASLSYSGPNGGSGSITATADLTTGNVTFSGSIALTTVATTGSEKGSCG